jgi:hypothetical protein
MQRKIMAVGLLLVLLVTGAVAQRITGSISGTVTDPQGAVVTGAKVTLSNDNMGFKKESTTSETGAFNFADIRPAIYKVTIEAQGFAPFVTTIPVRVGLDTPVIAKLNVGGETTEVTVAADATTIDVVQATVQGHVQGNQIDSLPLNGRNFLDLAQLQPGVQTVDGGSFDPTKNQFAGVSVGGRSGRVTRIQVDGVDVTDETVGTTVMNISNESIQEFGIAQSSLDPSTDMTSSGAINIITKSGTNDIHGAGFFQWRDARIAADQRLDNVGEKPPFDREVWGGRVGGPFMKDKMFWHVEYEQFSQDSQTITSSAVFPQFSGAHSSPVDETLAGGRFDWNMSTNVRSFYRFNHNHNIGVTGFGGSDLAAFSNRNNTNSHVAGLDYTTGRWTHSGRFSYLNFNNFVDAANALAGTPETLDPNGNPILVQIQGGVNVGPDLLAPQFTFQDNTQVKYDGSYAFGSHNVRFGGSYNNIDEAVFASFFGLAPRIRANRAASLAFAATNPFSAQGTADPLNFRVNQIRLGNGLGFFSEKPGHGRPFGGTLNHRLGFYVQDSWRASRSLTINGGVRWSWNSMLSDSDLERASIIGLFDPSLLGRPNRPADNFGPQAGFAWNVGGNGKTVIRGGAGIFFETNIINNVLFDRVVNLPPGYGNDTPFFDTTFSTVIDPGTGNVLFDFATDCLGGTASCFNLAIGSTIPDVLAAQALYRAATNALAANYPPPGVPPLIQQSLSASGSLVDTNYKTPYGAQMNIGVQRELKPGLVLAVDYVHNRGVHFNMVRDRNRLGAADTLDVALAQAAIAATLADFGCADIDCVIGAGGTIENFTDFGLGAGAGHDGNAFGGMNHNFRDMGVIESIGLSRFQALQVRLNGVLGSWGPFKRIHSNITYQLGRFESSGLDQDFISAAGFNDRPTAFFGPANADRLHQVGLTFLMELPYGFNLNTTTQLRSNLASSLFLPATTLGADEIFYSDLDGDGVTQDPLPGTTGNALSPRGAFGRSANAGNLNEFINNYNTVIAGTVLPAGQALISAGLFTETQLIALGATAVPITPAASDQLNNDSLMNTDLRLSNKIKITERVTVEPMVEVFNIFNIANYVAHSGFLETNPGDPNGSPASASPLDRGLDRRGFGSGSFSPGTQRAFQFGVRVHF